MMYILLINVLAYKEFDEHMAADQFQRVSPAGDGNINL